MADLVTRERYGHVLLIGINRPDKRNAFSLALIDEFAAAYEEFGDDPELWAAAVFAHGDHFSAGLDLAEVGPAVAERGPAALAGSRRYDPFGMWAPQVPNRSSWPCKESPSRCPLNWRWPATSSSPRTMSGSGNSRSRAGSCRSGATLRAPLRLGWGNAMSFLLTADEFGAAEAHRIGLVQEVVAPGAQVTRAVEIAGRIAAQAPLGVQATLANARIAAEQGFAAARADLVETLPTILASDDAREGVMSFVERREARFTGN